MTYLFQLFLILGFTFLGEVLAYLLPLPIPASVYGLVLLFLALRTKLVKLSHVEKTGKFLISVLSPLFIAPVVNLLACWDVIEPLLFPIALIVLLSTVLVFAVSGRLTQRFLKDREGRHD